MLEHPRQYLLSSGDLEFRTDDLLHSKFGSHSYVHSPLLDVTAVSTERSSLLLFGFIIDPMNPVASDQEILHTIAQTCSTAGELFSALQAFAGRFALFFRTEREFIVVGDACGGRHIFYSFNGSNWIVSSSLQLYWGLFQTGPVSSEQKRALISSSEYDATERAWFGDGTPDDRFSRVLPNHYLDVTRRRVQRIPFDNRQLAAGSDAVEYVGSLLRGSLEGIVHRFKVILPLTAGWDSRTSLAASREFQSRIEYFVFAAKGWDEKTADLSIPLRLSDKLDLFFRIVRPGAVRQDFRQECQKKHFASHPSRVGQIQYLFDQYGSTRTARASGLAADILKSSFYGHARRRVTDDMLYSFSGYYGKSEFVREQIRNWLHGAESFCEENSIHVQDLFYWEQRIGTWGALYAFEQDVAIEEFWPHGIRNLLMAGLHVEPAKRARPKCLFYQKLISQLWKEALEEPCNPLSPLGEVYWRIRNNSAARYYKLKLFGGK